MLQDKFSQGHGISTKSNSKVRFISREKINDNKKPTIIQIPREAKYLRLKSGYALFFSEISALEKSTENSIKNIIEIPLNAKYIEFQYYHESHNNGQLTNINYGELIFTNPNCVRKNQRNQKPECSKCNMLCELG